MKLAIQDLTKSFNKHKVLHSISLSIDKGEFVCILGPSGCGKTTLLRIIAGFETPDSGTVKIDNELVSSSSYNMPPEKRNIGMVFQSYALWPHMTVKQHLEFVIRYNRFLPPSIKKNSDDIIKKTIELTKLQGLEHKFPYQLSGGQKQRVALARALIGSPSLLLMDEPLSSLDAELRESLRKEIQHIHHITNNTVVYVTHDQAEALAIADRIVVMRNGKIEQVGTPREIYLNPISDFVAKFVSKANILKGKWQNDVFVYEAESHKIIIKKQKVHDNFIKSDICPVRPEELDITYKNQSNAIPAVIENIEYQGKGTFITVAINRDKLTIYLDFINDLYKIGQKVFIRLKESQLQSLYC